MGGREVKEDGTLCVMFVLKWKEEGVTHHSCATEGTSRARYSVSRRSRVLNTDVVESERCLDRRETDRLVSCPDPTHEERIW